jgi:hypothetical protein
MTDLRLPDRYSLQARLMPVILVILPMLLVAAGAIASGARNEVAFGVVMAALAALGAQVGRDRGRRLEASLWSSWGGSPTLARLRFRANRSHQVTASLHTRISDVLGDALPEEGDEQAHPDAADQQYDDAVRRLRGLTRDHRQFPLLFAENVNYGFRRNALRLRPFGIAVAVAVLAACCVLFGVTHAPLGHRAALYGPGASTSSVLLVFWIRTVSPDWVRIPAGAYADRLFEAVDVLSRYQRRDREVPQTGSV